MKEFIYRRKVWLQDTDATGVLYFSQQLEMALEALEEYLSYQGFPLRTLIDSPYLLPVVHAEADYCAPVRVGDELEIYLTVEAVGTKSVTFAYRLHDIKRQLTVGTAKIIHAVVERKTGQAIPIPDFLKSLLSVGDGSG